MIVCTDLLCFVSCRPKPMLCNHSSLGEISRLAFLALRLGNRARRTASAHDHRATPCVLHTAVPRLAIASRFAAHCNSQFAQVSAADQLRELQPVRHRATH